MTKAKANVIAVAIAIVLFYASGVCLGIAIGMMLEQRPPEVAPAGEVHLMEL